MPQRVRTSGVEEARRIAEIVRRLAATYGPRPWRRWGKPLDGLIATVLSQHTSDVNSDAAFSSLRRAFPSWRACMEARPEDVERAIRSGGLAKQKTRSIQAILRAIHERHGRRGPANAKQRVWGPLSLDFLSRWPMPRAREFLRSLPGVGPKTAACVLLFNLGKPALPVDTHVHRVARRLGLIPENTTAEQAHAILEAMCPPRLVYPFHVLLIQHGREICRARRAHCEICPLAELCPSAFKVNANQSPKRKRGNGRIEAQTQH